LDSFTTGGTAEKFQKAFEESTAFGRHDPPPEYDESSKRKGLIFTSISLIPKNYLLEN
jgi:hypothetical protein